MSEETWKLVVTGLVSFLCALALQLYLRRAKVRDETADKLSAMHVDIVALRTRIDTYEGRLSAQAAGLAGVESLLHRMDNHVTALQATMRHLEASIGRVDAHLTRMDTGN